jgi:hypothetical protein
VAAKPEPKPEPAAEPVAEKPKPAAAKPEPAAAETAEDRMRTRERERARRKPVVTEEADEEAATEPKREREPARAGAALSPGAQSALKRRRVIGATAGLAVLAAIVVGILAIAGVFSSDSKKSSSASPATTTPGTSTTAQQQVQVLGQIALNPIGGAKAQGIAYVVQQGTQRYIVVQAQVPPLPNNQKVAAYEVWLYNSNADARSLGAQYTNAQGVLQGRAPLPADVTKFKAIDVSRELFADKNAGHANSSILRGTFASLKPVPPQPAPGGTSTTPAGP